MSPPVAVNRAATRLGRALAAEDTLGTGLAALVPLWALRGESLSNRPLLFLGVLLMVMGWLRLGAWVRYVPVSIVTGFTNGIAVLIGLSQIKDLLGLNIDKLPADFFTQASGEKDVTVKGNLTLHGVTQPIEVTSHLTRQGKGFESQTEMKLKLTDYGIAIPKYDGITIAEDVELKVHFAAE